MEFFQPKKFINYSDNASKIRFARSFVLLMLDEAALVGYACFVVDFLCYPWSNCFVSILV